MKDMDMSISMKCSICGNDQFSVVDETIEDLMDAPDETEVICSDCGYVTTKEQLIDDNSYIIDANLEGFKDEILKKIEIDIKKMFK